MPVLFILGSFIGLFIGESERLARERLRTLMKRSSLWYLLGGVFYVSFTVCLFFFLERLHEDWTEIILLVKEPLQRK